MTRFQRKHLKRLYRRLPVEGRMCFRQFVLVKRVEWNLTHASVTRALGCEPLVMPIGALEALVDFKKLE